MSKPIAAKAGPGQRVFAAVGVFLLALGLVVAVVIIRNRAPVGDPGALVEASVTRPASVPLPALADATREWALNDLGVEPAIDKMAGGAAVGDIDGDGDQDVVIANGDVVVLLWDDDGYENPRHLGPRMAIGVSLADVDRDGWIDILVATASNNDLIFWGGSWLVEGGQGNVLELAADGQSSGLMAAELSGDSATDIVRLGRGKEEPVPDVLWVADSTSPRSFTSVELPEPDRYSLAGELVDADGDGLVDIWITRDVGWAVGADSILSRKGDPTGEWQDIADDLGAALEVDGMGITVADLNGDAALDAYISDLGDNEQLLGTNDGFVPITNTGAAHIRPVGAPDSVVSSTWGTGALDVNLDGVLDLVLVSGGFPEGTVRNKIDDTEVAIAEPPSILLGLGDGQFVDVWPELGLDVELVARGLTVADLDGDGDDDILAIDRRGGVVALRNDTEGPSVTIALPTCPDLAGAVAVVDVDGQLFSRLLAPHGYASAHGRSFAVGAAAGAPVSAHLKMPGGEQDTLVVESNGERQSLESFSVLNGC